MNVKIKKMWAGLSITGFALCSLSFAPSDAGAANPQNWSKKWNQKMRRTTQRRTSVAAVRGVDEASQIDPNARDFDGVKSMEARTIPNEKVSQFIAEGQLNKIKIEPASSTAPKEGVKP